MFRLIPFLVFLVFSLNGCKYNSTSVFAKNGTISLQNVDWNSGSYSLDGEWLLLWAGKEPLPIVQPGSWIGLELNGNHLPREGWAEYRLKLLLDSTAPNPLVISTKEINSQSQIWVNGTQIPDIGNGRLSIPVYPKNHEIELRIGVHNVLDIRPGIPCPVLIATPDIMSSRESLYLGIQFLLFGFFALLACLYTASWLLRRKERASLLLAMHSTSWGLYTLFLGVAASPAETIFPNLPVVWMQKAALLSTAFSFPMTCRLWLELFPSQLLRRTLPLLDGASIATALTLIFIESIHWQWYHAYLLVGNFFMFLLLLAVSSAVYRREEGARVFLVGLLIFFAVIIVSTIHFRGEWVGAGALALVLADSFLLTKRRAQAFETIEMQSAELLRAKNLREELTQEVQQKLAHQKMETRFSALLDHVDQPLLVIDEEDKICYVNQGFMQILGEQESCIGKSWEELCSIEKPIAPGLSVCHFQQANHIPLILTARKITIGLAGESLEALLFQTKPRTEYSDNRYQDMESAESILDPRQLACTIMDLSLQIWEKSTGLEKSDFATTSGLWKVNMDANGWRRAPTLDKYLEVSKIPRLPKWRKVLDSADFVLATARHRNWNEPQIQELEGLKNQLEQMV